MGSHTFRVSNSNLQAEKGALIIEIKIAEIAKQIVIMFRLWKIQLQRHEGKFLKQIRLIELWSQPGNQNNSAKVQIRKANTQRS